MKKLQFTLKILLLTFFMSSAVNAQIIDSLEILPSNPTSSDIIKIESNTFFLYSSCYIVDWSIDVQNSNISINTVHDMGYATALCYSRDTLTIGQLNAGTYELIYYLSLSNPNDTDSDTDTLYFTVQDSSDFQVSDYSDENINIYPNPASSQITIDLERFTTDKVEINIYSILGQKMRTLITDKSKVSIDISDLREGVYFVGIIEGKEKIYVKRIIKKKM